MLAQGAFSRIVQCQVDGNPLAWGGIVLNFIAAKIENSQARRCPANMYMFLQFLNCIDWCWQAVLLVK